MIYDFSFYLFVAVAVTGLIWLFDWMIFSRIRPDVIQSESEMHKGVEISAKNKEPIIVEYSKSFFPVLLIVFLLRGFIVEPFRIPSGSMLPTLYIGDFILVKKYAYGVKLPVLNIKIFDVETPKRGDIVVFRFPRDETIDYIKRVIGLPGDHIAYYNKVLHVNGKPAKRVFVEQYQGPGQEYANEYQEDLENMEHSILLLPGSPGSLEGEYIVPDDMYFVMGDNRDRSSDSRVWGPVPAQNLVGQAFMIWMHWSDGIEWNRIGTMID